MRRYREETSSYLWIIIFLLLVLLFLFSALLLDAKSAWAGSQFCGGPFDKSCAQVEYEMRMKRQARARARARARKRHHARKRARRHSHSTRVYGYRREERDSDRVACKPLLTVIGDARPTRQAAVNDAEAAFMRATRFKYGEAWLEVENAKDYEIRCARASITEIIGQVMQRCELRARPCRPPFESRKE